jgi:two-component system NtrC family sensor kinase
LTYTRQEDTEKKSFRYIDITTIIEKALRLLNYKITKNNINIKRIYEPNIPNIYICANQIQQVLLNLISNAADALESAENKNITVHIYTKKDFLFVKIIDNGAGISPDNKYKIFDAFFTTKTINKGTGLGLSICKGIMDEHNAEIAFESKETFGTEFSLKFSIKDKSNI